MKNLLSATAAIELGAGVALLVRPDLVGSILLGEPLTGHATWTVARIGGAGLASLGLACWMTRGTAHSPSARGLLAGMLLYNVAAMVVLAYAGLADGLVGPALWPAVGLHVGMTAWCLKEWLKRPTS